MFRIVDEGRTCGQLWWGKNKIEDWRLAAIWGIEDQEIERLEMEYPRLDWPAFVMVELLHRDQIDQGQHLALWKEDVA